MKKWTVAFHDDFEPEVDELPEAVQDELYAHAALLETFGPELGRPHADTLDGSKHANTKELRFRADNGYGVSPLPLTLSVKRCFSWLAINPAQARSGFTNGSSRRRTAVLTAISQRLRGKKRKRKGKNNGQNS